MTIPSLRFSILIVCLLFGTPIYSATMTGGLFYYSDTLSTAPGKVGLNINTSASSSNFTNNSIGISGLKLSFDDANGIVANDFSYRTGNINNVTSWTQPITSISSNVDILNNDVFLSFSNPILDSWLEIEYNNQYLYFGNLVGDSSFDGYVTPIDALLIMNHINSGDTTYVYNYDINGDNSISPLDALLIINKLNDSNSVLELANGPFDPNQSGNTGTTFPRIDPIQFTPLFPGAISPLQYDDRVFNEGWTLDIAKSDSNGQYELVMMPVPEPSTILLLGTGLIGMIGLKRRHKK